MSHRVNRNIFTNALTGTGTEITPPNDAQNHAIGVQWGAGATQGVVVIEAGPYKGYTGTWVNLTTFNWAAANTFDLWRGQGPFDALRARITTTVDGAGVTVNYSAN